MGQFFARAILPGHHISRNIKVKGKIDRQCYRASKLKHFRTIIGDMVGQKVRENSQFNISIICPSSKIHYAYKKKKSALRVGIALGR